MRIFVFILILQVFLAGTFLNLSNTNTGVHSFKYSIRQVLGTSFFADDVVPLSDQPTDTSTLEVPVETAVPVQNDTPTPSSSNELINSTPVPGGATDIPTPLSETPSFSSANQIENTSTSTDIMSQDQNYSFNNNILNPEDIAISSENINTSVITHTNNEDEILDKTVDPSKKVALLSDSAEFTVKNISASLKSKDLSTTSYLVQRLVSGVEQAQLILGANSINTQKAKQQFKTFCEKADFDLKTQQLQVPENLEQDMEIARGICLATQ